MSTWLVDTHALLWFLGGDDQLSEWARETIEDGGNIIVVSAASIWEMAIKTSLGRLDVPADLLEILDQHGFLSLSIEPRHAWAVADLPLGAHRDPFDRQLAAQALVEDLPIISADEELDQYGVTRRW